MKRWRFLNATILVALLLALTANTTNAQQRTKFFKDVSNDLVLQKHKTEELPTQFRTVEFEEDEMRAYLRKITTGEIECGVITLPMPDGTEMDFEVKKSRGIPDKLLKAEHSISLRGVGINDKYNTIVISGHKNRIEFSIRTPKFGYLLIEKKGTQYYISFYRNNIEYSRPDFKCGYKGVNQNVEKKSPITNEKSLVTASLRKFRIVLTTYNKTT